MQRGGHIDLSGVVTLSGAIGFGDRIDISTVGAGTIDLSSQTTVSAGVVAYTANGTGSLIDATPLVTYDGLNVTFTELSGGVILHQ